jgi:hypothetical protein
MSGKRNHWLVRLYPAAWRDRYGAELEELLKQESSARVVFDVIRAATIEWFLDVAGMGVRRMPTYRDSVITMAKHPSAFVPTILSGLALIELLIFLAVFGIGGGSPAAGTHDEGPAAHIYQLLIGAQFLIVPWFVLRWGWRDWRAGMTLVALQMLAITVSFVPLWLIEHSL